MTRVLNIATLLPLFLLACATPRPPAELVEARTAYHDAEIEAARVAPTELRDARLALDKAESAFKEEPRAAETRDRAYIAQRSSQLAAARAAVVVAHERRDASYAKLRSLGVEAAVDLRESRRDVSDAEKRTQDAQRDTRRLQGELVESESAAAALGTKLDGEQEARHEAELQLMSALQSLNAEQVVREEPRGLVITLSGGVLFESGGSSLRAPARTALDKVATALITVPERAITIAGHTDARGSTTSNQLLSERRSEAVRAYLISRGVAAANITAIGHGEDQPLADNESAEGRAENRRVEIVLAPAAAKP